jgi:hypothetical protein
VLILRVPDGAPAEYVRWIWLYRGEPLGFQSEIVMPTGDPDLVVDLTRARTVASGPSNRPFVLDTGAPPEAIGAVLKIGGAATLLGVPLTDSAQPPRASGRTVGAQRSDLVGRA